MYITVDQVKKHLNIDFNEDDAYLQDLIDAAEDYAATYCRRDITELAPNGLLRPAVAHAVKLLVGSWYDNREAVGHVSHSELPYGVCALLMPHKRFV